MKPVKKELSTVAHSLINKEIMVNLVSAAVWNVCWSHVYIPIHSLIWQQIDMPILLTPLIESNENDII